MWAFFFFVFAGLLYGCHIILSVSLFLFVLSLFKKSSVKFYWNWLVVCVVDRDRCFASSNICSVWNIVFNGVSIFSPSPIMAPSFLEFHICFNKHHNDIYSFTWGFFSPFSPFFYKLRFPLSLLCRPLCIEQSWFLVFICVLFSHQRTIKPSRWPKTRLICLREYFLLMESIWWITGDLFMQVISKFK